MSIEVKLELGHKASMKEKPTPEGFTHDWTVFVRGCEGSNIVHFVDKVVFHLHESFPKPKRVVKEPPYQVSESGYAGFIMPIEVYFRSKEEPKKVRFEYDLFLRLEGSPVYNIRLEKLTFQNPSDDFRRKLLKARSERASQATTGGEGRIVPTAAIAPIQLTPEEPRQQPPPQQQQPLQQPHAKAPVAEKRPKSNSSAKEPSKAPAPPAKPASQPFENIFGTPIKAKSSPDPSAKNKDSSISNHQKPQKTLQPQLQPAAPVKEIKAVTKEQDTKEVKAKPPKPEKEQKTGTKRPLTPEVTNHHSNSSAPTPTNEKKRKHANSSGGTSKKTSDSSNSNSKTEKTKEKKEKVKSKSSSSSSSSSSLTSKKDKHKSSSHSKSANANTSHKLPSPPDVFSQSQNTDSNGTKPFLKSEDSSSNTPHSSAPILSPAEKSLSPPTQELDNDFLALSSDEDNIVPARSKEKLQNSSAGGSSSNHHSDDFENSNSNHAFSDRPSSRASGKSNSSVKPKKSPTKNHKNNSKHSNSSSPAAIMKDNHVNSPGSSIADSPNSPKPVKALDSDYHQELVDLQKQIMGISDQHQLQKIVDVIEKTGKFSITSSSFDFDLCSLDIGTVRQLKNCLSM